LLLSSFDSKHAGEWSVTIITTTSSVQEISLDNWVSWAEVFIPSDTVWLLIKMSINHDILVDSFSCFDNIADKRKTVFSGEYLLRKTLDA
jgi:hypothetical protein